MSVPSAVRDAYGARAAEYAEHLGTLAATHPADRALVADWADGITDPVLGGGVDLVPAFVAHARRTHPGIPFSVGSMDALDVPTAGLGGALAWYSLIHHAPAAVAMPLGELARAIRPGGGFLVGAFVGSATEPFDHAVTRAWRWSVDDLQGALAAAGFDAVETHLRTGSGHRPHVAITARRRDADAS